MTEEELTELLDTIEDLRQQLAASQQREAEKDRQTATLREAVKNLLQGYELDYSGCDVRYTFAPEEWERRIDAVKRALGIGGGEGQQP